MSGILLSQWHRCDDCSKYKETKVIHNVGDQVSYPKVTHGSRTTKIEIKKGKLDYISSDGKQASVKAPNGRTTVVEVESLSSAHGSGQLTVSIIGECACD